MEHLGQSVAATLSTESLGEWAGQPSSTTARKAPHFTITSRSSEDQTKTTTTTSKTDTSHDTTKSTHLSTAPPHSGNTPTSSTLQPPHPSRGPSRSPSRTRSEQHRTPTPTPGAVHAAHVASMHPAHYAQAQAQIPETARMTKARRAPCCQWKHEDRKHHLHMAWMHHYTPST